MIRLAVVALGACASTAAPLANVGGAPADTYTVDDTHVGPIAAGTRVSVDALRRLFPRADVRASQVTSYDHPLDTVEVRLDARAARPSLVLVALTSPSLIYSDPTGHPRDELVSLRILDPAFRPDPRWGIGTRRSALEPLFGRLDCTAMVDRDAGKLACTPANRPDPAISFIFADAASPDPELTELLWRPVVAPPSHVEP